MISVTIENTSFCGANCVMCPREQYRFPKENMEESLFEKIVKQVYEAGIRQIDIGGYGDPLTDAGLKEKLHYVKDNYPEMRVAMISTCQLLKGEMADLIADKVDDLKISNYGISAASYEAVHRGSLKYEMVHENILKFLEREKRPHVMMAYLILQGLNDSEIDEWRNYWEDKADDIQIWYPHNYAGAKSEFDNTLDYDWSETKTCGRPGKDFVFCANGDVTACCFDFNHNLLIGNIYQESFQEIMEGTKLKNISEIHEKNVFKGCGLICEHCDQILDRNEALYYSSNKGFRVGQKSQRA